MQATLTGIVTLNQSEARVSYLAARLAEIMVEQNEDPSQAVFVLNEGSVAWEIFSRLKNLAEELSDVIDHYSDVVYEEV